jgi:hypothetical protein
MWLAFCGLDDIDVRGGVDTLEFAAARKAWRDCACADNGPLVEIFEYCREPRVVLWVPRARIVVQHRVVTTD